ncbi:MAG: lycopene beta-cyclase CrtY [Archangium sp.]
MTPTSVILVGAGLANGLIADRLVARRLDLKVTVLEAGPKPGGNHTWCFHGTDVAPSTLAWLEHYVSARWNSHDVIFPSMRRTLDGEYFAIRSEDFATRLTERLGDRLRTNVSVKEIDGTTVTLSDGTKLSAAVVLDGRGLQSDSPAHNGFQKFVGREVLLREPHGLTRPLLMDASVEQLDGFRFIYVLPWDERRVLVEDTRYSDTAQLDVAQFRADLDVWMQKRGWSVESVQREEVAALPIPLDDEGPEFSRPLVGVSGGFFHATTGYSLPFAAAVAELITEQQELDATKLTALLHQRSKAHWESMGFFRLLNRMLFRGAAPSERVKVFQSFYRHSPELIARFYAGTLTWSDKLSALARGAPTVPAFKAMRAAFS